MCLATDACLTVDPGVASSIRARSPYFVNFKYFRRSFSSLSLNRSRRIVVSYKQKYVHKVYVKLLVQACPGKKCGR